MIWWLLFTFHLIFLTPPPSTPIPLHQLSTHLCSPPLPVHAGACHTNAVHHLLEMPSDGTWEVGSAPRDALYFCKIVNVTGRGDIIALRNLKTVQISFVSELNIIKYCQLFKCSFEANIWVSWLFTPKRCSFSITMVFDLASLLILPHGAGNSCKFTLSSTCAIGFPTLSRKQAFKQQQQKYFSYSSSCWYIKVQRLGIFFDRWTKMKQIYLDTCDILTLIFGKKI